MYVAATFDCTGDLPIVMRQNHGPLLADRKLAHTCPIPAGHNAQGREIPVNPLQRARMARDLKLRTSRRDNLADEGDLFRRQGRSNPNPVVPLIVLLLRQRGQTRHRPVVMKRRVLLARRRTTRNQQHLRQRRLLIRPPPLDDPLQPRIHVPIQPPVKTR